jgi:serine/threonine-protein kinase
MLGSRYEVGELLGYGGMAEVHRGRDLRLGRDVAIKMLRTDLARDNTFQLRFRREAQNAASLNHPAIAAIYDTGEERGATGESLPYIVMEFVNGHTLKEVLAAEQRLQPRRALEITADICAALDFSHRHGIIHRDVKPGNVMITGNGQVKVMDFGIARDLGSGATTMTQTSAVIGTAQYLSPEQARGEAVDARSDVYATGCVLFELLCGYPPFVGDSPVAVAYQHVKEDPRPPSQFNPEVGPDIDAVVLKALAKNPANRYQSAAEMRADLLRAAAGRPVLATPVLPEHETVLLGEQARVGDPERRRASTWVLASLAVLGVLAVIALIVGLILTSRAGGDLVDVPPVIGMTADEAEDAITTAGLEPQPGEPVASADCTVDLVAEQTPEPGGDQVRRGSVVTYRICGGPEMVTMPNVVGSIEAAATAQLEALGLTVTTEPIDSPMPLGIVVETEPEPGAEVEKGSEVILRVSAQNLTAVPDVVDRPQNEATAILQAAGFEVQVVTSSEQPTSPEQVGRVQGQDPEAGATEEQGSEVTIFIYPPGAQLSVPAPTINNMTVTVEWDNGIYGGVVIDWGDDSEEQAFEATGSHSYVYAAPDTYTITVRSVIDPDRVVVHDVTVPGP